MVILMAKKTKTGKKQYSTNLMSRCNALPMTPLARHGPPSALEIKNGKNEAINMEKGAWRRCTITKTEQETKLNFSA